MQSNVIFMESSVHQDFCAPLESTSPGLMGKAQLEHEKNSPTFEKTSQNTPDFEDLTEFEFEENEGGDDMNYDVHYKKAYAMLLFVRRFMIGCAIVFLIFCRYRMINSFWRKGIPRISNPKGYRIRWLEKLVNRVKWYRLGLILQIWISIGGVGYMVGYMMGIVGNMIPLWLGYTKGGGLFCKHWKGKFEVVLGILFFGFVSTAILVTQIVLASTELMELLAFLPNL